MDVAILVLTFLCGSTVAAVVSASVASLITLVGADFLMNVPERRQRPARKPSKARKPGKHRRPKSTRFPGLS